MKDILFLLILLLLFVNVQGYSQNTDSLSQTIDSLIQKKPKEKKKSLKVDEKDESLMDRVQKILGIRRSFDVTSETTKPALLSFKKDDDKDAVFNVDVAFTYRGFRYDGWGFSPSVQFDYSSKPKDQLEKLKGGLNVYYTLFDTENSSGRIEPEIYYAKDFYNKVEQFQTSLSYIPRYPDFFIPIRNISNYKFKYDGEDNRWVFGLNPIIGLAYNRTYGGSANHNETDYFTFLAADVTLKRYFVMLDFFGRYELQFKYSDRFFYKYNTNFILFLDEKERSSINVLLEQQLSPTKRSRKIIIGFGVKL